MTALGDPVVGEWFARLLPHAADRTAVVGVDREFTYAELEAASDHVARGLVAQGLGSGEVVAVLSENLAATVVLLFACAKAGSILAVLNWRLTPEELRQYLEVVDPRLLLASDAQMARAAAALPQGTGPQPFVATIERLSGATTTAILPAVELNDGLMLVATSGSTGRPKAALLTHGNFFATNRALDEIVPIGRDDVVLQVLPQFHIGGWNVQPMQAWMNGATVVIEQSFDAGHVLDEIARQRITTMACVPAMLLMLAEHPLFPSTDLTSLRSVVVGGASAQQGMVELWMGRGVAVHQGYGLTEAGPNVLCLPARWATTKPGAVGWPYPSVDVALVEGATQTIVEGVGSGEVQVRGPGVFREYWKDADATAAAFAGDWLRTGDVASRDIDGCYTIIGRSKEMYISGGENVFPIEVERVISTFPGVADAAVVAVPHDKWGEVGVAYVESSPGLIVPVDALESYCRSKLAGYKVPSLFVVVHTLPRTSVGKADKIALRKRVVSP